MADLTRTEMINRVLEHLGVKGASQSASAADAQLVGEVVDSQLERLRAMDLAPFESSAIPPWAMVPLRDLVAMDVAPSFGLGAEQMQAIALAAARARQDLARSRYLAADEFIAKPRWF